jgi:hypothetical protein
MMSGDTAVVSSPRFEFFWDFLPIDGELPKVEQQLASDTVPQYRTKISFKYTIAKARIPQTNYALFISHILHVA